MTPSPADILNAALQARTVAEADQVAALIIDALGVNHERPVADRGNTLGVLSTSSGSYEHRLLEQNTNMHDAVLERFARARFGEMAAVPYQAPHEAAEELLGHLSDDAKAELAGVEFFQSGDSARKNQRLTAVFRDQGCGLTPSAVPWTIFRVGSDHKDAAPWLQGAFGLGGATTYRNARAVVLVTRRDPDLLRDDEEDRITVAVCRWRQQGKGQGLYYQVTKEWNERRSPDAEPWSTPARNFPDFPVGTHLALISYEAPNFVRGRNDRRGFQFVQATRLPAPVLPTRFVNYVVTGDHPKTLSGLKRQFEDNPRPDRLEFREHLLFRSGGKAYELPVHAYVFTAGPSADKGGKRNFVAEPHAAILCSNGQAHQHWTPAELRRHCPKLNKAYDRIFVVVDTDPLPVELRTSLFTADRSGFINSGEAGRLEGAVAKFLDGWDPLVDYNRQLILEAMTTRGERSATRKIAEKIARALKARGFGLSGGRGEGGDGAALPKGKPPGDLYPDPTTLEGPNKVIAQRGETKYVRYHVNAVDEFFTSGRGTLSVSCSHPDIDDGISIGELHQGRVRVAIAVPEDAELGSYHLTAGLYDWMRSAGGVGGSLEWKADFEVVDELPERQPPKRKKKDQKPKAGDLLAVQWRHNDAHEHWDSRVPGHVDYTPAEILAQDEEYAELRDLGDTPIPTLWLNLDYAPLKEYEHVRLRNLTNRGVDDARDRYAVGAGVGMLEAFQSVEKLKKANGGIEPETEDLFKHHTAAAAARSALAMMPEYDRLLQEAGLGDTSD